MLKIFVIYIIRLYYSSYIIRALKIKTLTYLLFNHYYNIKCILILHFKDYNQYKEGKMKNLSWKYTREYYVSHEKRIFSDGVYQRLTKKNTIEIGGPLIEGYPLFSRNWQQGRSMRGTFNWQLFVEAARPTP